MTNNKTLFRYIDVLTILSCFAVVVLHCNVVFWAHPSGRTWISSNILETVFYFAVPCFFMITGFTLIDFSDRYDVKSFFKKRLYRTMLPFIIWSILGYIIWFFCWNESPFEGFFPVLLNIVNSKYVDIYWFFICLFAVYLSIPVLNKISNKLLVFKWLIAYSFISYSIIPFLEQLFHFSLNWGWKSPISSGYIIYILLGYYLGNIELARKTRVLIYGLGGGSLLLHCVGTILLSPEGGAINGLFKGYLNFPCVLYSVSVFVFCKYTNWDFLYNRAWVAQTLNLIKSSSLGVYLIHIYFVRIALWHLHISQSSWTFRTLGCLVIFTLCVVIVQLTKKTCLGKYLFP